MAGEIIRKGDPTSHGGVVLEGSMTDICMGQPIAFFGHKVHCPKCKGVFPIAEGVPTTTFYGKGVALAGMKTACGAVLIATQFSDTVEYGSGAAQPAASITRATMPAILAKDAFGNALGSSLASMNSSGTEQQQAAPVTSAKSSSDSIARDPGSLQNWQAVNPDGTSTAPNFVSGLDAYSPDAPSPPGIRSVGGNPAIINAELKKLPSGVTDALRDGGIQIVAVKDSIVEAFPDLKGVTPRGWGGTGKTWDDVPGVFKSDRMTVAVATSGKFPTGSNDMILHEIGHGYDFAMGKLSGSSSFISAYDADKAHFTGYYTQPGDAGHEELFAESFANFYNRNTKYFENKPNVLSYWTSLPQPMQPAKVRK